MPYTKESPPDQIKKLPSGAQSIWIGAFNSALKSGKDEDSARKIAWAAVKGSYSKDKEGNWNKKSMVFNGFIIPKIENL